MCTGLTNTCTCTCTRGLIVSMWLSSLQPIYSKIQEKPKIVMINFCSCCFAELLIFHGSRSCFLSPRSVTSLGPATGHTSTNQQSFYNWSESFYQTVTTRLIVCNHVDTYKLPWTFQFSRHILSFIEFYLSLSLFHFNCAIFSKQDVYNYYG